MSRPEAGRKGTAVRRGIIINLTAQKVIRLAPPINISSELWDWNKGLDLLVETIAGLDGIEKGGYARS